ncbi:hypothetical protein [Magnetospirillum sp. UT-4]|uniref:hypothetical protein n=1 Tax=Magnetospirillum sp. UT-4 TaxID=2681467 RepID=UPI00137C5007|nr:hypothetical protein [Magnetospirillum sp. UT-4]CAA7617614.1 conserved hypothetical protein [Magnetospirillum sp. UT-4]
MGRARYIPRQTAEVMPDPFASAEEAWLWYSRCQVARLEGVRCAGGLGLAERPCDPDDIVRAVMGLVRRGILAVAHLSVLGRFGARLAVPDPAAGDSQIDSRLWTEALDRLETVLRGKGIVA